MSLFVQNQAISLRRGRAMGTPLSDAVGKVLKFVTLQKAPGRRRSIFVLSAAVSGGARSPLIFGRLYCADGRAKGTIETKASQKPIPRTVLSEKRNSNEEAQNSNALNVSQMSRFCAHLLVRDVAV